jgi:hypothetical protein
VGSVPIEAHARPKAVVVFRKMMLKKFAQEREEKGCGDFAAFYIAQIRALKYISVS